MKQTPKKDKKLSAGYVSYVTPDAFEARWNVTTAIKHHVAPTDDPAQQASLGFFIDRRYLELCQDQNVQITNLSQNMEGLKVQWPGIFDVV